MPALVAGIHVFLAASQQARRGWPGQARTSPAMTPEKWLNLTGMRSRYMLRFPSPDTLCSLASIA